MDEIFLGFIRTTVKCPRCNLFSISIEKIRSISLDLYDRTINNLDDALFHYFRTEVIESNEYTCHSCKSQISPVKQVYLEKLPNVLCIYLKRFDPTHQKILKHLRFSQFLNLEPYLINELKNAVPTFTYLLTSVIAHIGSSIDNGHYTTAAKESNGKFYTFNDSQVQPTSVNNVSGIDAYILMFEMIPIEDTTASSGDLNNNVNNEVTNIIQEQDVSVNMYEDDVNSLRKKIIIAAALLALSLDLTDLPYKPKDYLERPIFQMREKCGFYHTSVLLLKNEEAKFRNFTWMSVKQFEELTNMIAPIVDKSTLLREPISTRERLLVTLRYLAIGDHQISLSYLFNISPTAISNIVSEVCEAIWQCLSPKVFHELAKEDWRDISADFATQCHYPHCIGAIDGKHVTIQAPANAGSEYYNYKGHHSIVLLAVSDANYVFRFIDIGAPGRQSDGGVFTKSNIWKLLECGNANIPQKDKLGHSELAYVFVGDAAFPLTEYLLTPFSAVWSTAVEKRVYNYRHAYARGRIENAFGIRAAKWRIYRRPINCSIETTIKIVKSTVCLHNWLRMNDLKSDKPMYVTPTCVDKQSKNGKIVGTWRKVHGDSLNMLPLDRTSSTVFLAGVEIRQSFCDYFNGEGALSWQHKYV